MTYVEGSRVFTAPGPGTWEQDSTHCPRPMTQYTFEAFRDAFPRGVREGTARYGLLFSHLEPALVNSFVYYRATFVDPQDRDEVGRRLAAAEQAFESKLWLTDLERWDREYKHDSIRRNRTLEAVPLAELDDEGLIAHLGAVRDNAREMIYRHHIFTVPSVLPVGSYLAHAMEWTGLDAGLLLAPFKGTTPVSLGAYDQLLAIGAALRQSGVGPDDHAGRSARDVLDALAARRDGLGDAVRAYVQGVGLRLAGGYDVADHCAVELPELLLKTIWTSPDASTRRPADPAVLTQVRDRVPDRHRPRFDDLVHDVQRINRLRDERGIYNDLWGTGIARQAILEAGRRLAAAGRIDEPDNALDATHAEQVALLGGGAGPSRAELAERTAWRRTGVVSDADQLLGDPPAPPPPLDALPPRAAEAMRAFGAALSVLFVPPRTDRSTAVAGKAVSPGVYTGTARVVRDASEFVRIQKGDILVTQSTSAGFNVLLPLLGAIVTDRGGQLSHTAIVAREYGIPAVVGTLNATTVIPDGARITVDGGTGRVELP